jgi:hypothetical protein
VAHVNAARSVYDFAVKILSPVARMVLKTSIHYLLTTPGAKLATFWKKVEQKPHVAGQYLIEKGDLMLGQAWRAEVAGQNFFNKKALLADKELFEGSISKEDDLTKKRPDLTLEEFKAMSHEERESICFLIRAAVRQRTKAADAVSTLA